MNDDHSPKPEHDIRERIGNLIRANEQAQKKQLPGKDLQKLKNAATRLDRLLRDAAGADTQALKDAAARLDRLLADLSKGIDITPQFKRRAGLDKPGDK